MLQWLKQICHQLKQEQRLPRGFMLRCLNSQNNMD